MRAKACNPNEITIADTLKAEGYTTACIGKWHLGDQKVFLPTHQGFDSYFGIPYSNDMGTKQFPINPPLPLLRNEDVIEAPVDQTTLTRRYTDEAISFIQANQENPFFLYLPLTMPHNPVHVSPEFKDQSENGLYADCVEEIDWSTGKILDTLDKLNLSGRTLVIFTSDNRAAKRWGGSNAPLSGYKDSVQEGGMRVPCIAHWPSQIMPGQRPDELTTTMDLFPTFVSLAGGDLPTDRHIDGRDIWPMLTDSEEMKTKASVFYYYRQDQLQAVRFGKWKLYLPLAPVRVSPTPAATAKTAPRLYDLQSDISESENLGVCRTLPSCG